MVKKNMEFYLKESDNAKVNTTPLQHINKNLCTKCGRNLGGYCTDKNMWIPHAAICDKYYLKKNLRL